MSDRTVTFYFNTCIKSYRLPVNHPLIADHGPIPFPIQIIEDSSQTLYVNMSQVLFWEISKEVEDETVA